MALCFTDFTSKSSSLYSRHNHQTVSPWYIYRSTHRERSKNTSSLKKVGRYQTIYSHEVSNFTLNIHTLMRHNFCPSQILFWLRLSPACSKCAKANASQAKVFNFVVCASDHLRVITLSADMEHPPSYENVTNPRPTDQRPGDHEYMELDHTGDVPQPVPQPQPQPQLQPRKAKSKRCEFRKSPVEIPET